MATTKKTAPEVEPIIEEEVKVTKKEVRKPSVDNELVRVTLFRDNDKYKDDVLVAVNGKAWNIQRGVEVEIPRYVWLVLEASLSQDNETAKMIAGLTSSANF